jgi:hypothetical protein
LPIPELAPVMTTILFSNVHSRCLTFLLFLGPKSHFA